MAQESQIDCKKHGLTKHKLLSGGKNRPKKWTCVKCLRSRQMARRKNNKIILVKEHGGKCKICGYDKIPQVLDFHHIDPSQKDARVSFVVQQKSMATARLEASKCILLCKNCHAEIEHKFALTIEKLDRILGG